eukprot:GGOE01041916.1.p1 GENE.GGOE01041916.1~~GGOE01041916.1.p1  ORF type:complete len:534 (+),score=145.05 GGOE01041916.1:235-1602(+)
MPHLALPFDLQWLADADQVQQHLRDGWDPNVLVPTPACVAEACHPDACSPLWLASKLCLPATVVVLLAHTTTDRGVLSDNGGPSSSSSSSLASVQQPAPSAPISRWLYGPDDDQGGREVEVLEVHGDCCLVRFKDTGEEGVLPKDELYSSDDPDWMEPEAAEAAEPTPMNRIGQLRQRLLGTEANLVVRDQYQMVEYSRILWSDPKQFGLYNAAPWKLQSRGVTLLNRTFMECKIDAVARPLVLSVVRELHLKACTDAEWVQRTGITFDSNSSSRQVPKIVVVDLFAGSGNMSFWFHHVLGCDTFGFEANPEVHRLAALNLLLMGMPSVAKHLLPLDFRDGLRRLAATGAVPPDALLVCLIDPPWGDAMSLEHGLDLRRTMPPAMDIIGSIVEFFPLEVAQERVFFLIHTYFGRMRNHNPSVREVMESCTWADVRRVPKRRKKQRTRQGYLFGFL